MGSIQWWIQGRGPGVRPPPLFLDQTEAQRAKKIFLETAHPPPPLFSQGLDPALALSNFEQLDPVFDVQLYLITYQTKLQ